MADERWLRDLNHDPDLVRLAGDDVDKLIKSTREELDYADRIMRSGRPQEPEFSTPQSYRKEVFQPKIPDIYADWTQEEEEPEEPIKPPRKRLAAGWRVLIYVVSVVAASVLLAFAGWHCADDVMALTKPDRSVSITVGEHDTMDDIVDTLEANDLIDLPWLFRFYCWFSNAEEKIVPGTYELNNVYDYHALVSGMSGNSNRITRTVTIPEGYSCDQIFTMLEQEGVCRAEDLYDAAANSQFSYDFLQDLPYGKKNRLEGYLFPDTYEFYSVKSEKDNSNVDWTWPDGAVGDDPERVLEKFLDNFQQKFTEDMQASIDTLNQKLTAQMEANGFTSEEIAAGQMDLHKIIIVASLIEKETASVAESSLISSVIYNRLCSKDYPLLQIDATVLYALGEHKETLTAEDLMVDSPYNTRRYPGLPVGPIANPGLASIQAALNPEDTNYFFYALDTDGTHHFSETNQEHEQFLSQLENDAE